MRRVGKKQYLLLLCFMIFAFAAPLMVRAASDDDVETPEIVVAPYRYEVSLGEVYSDSADKNARILNVYLIEPVDAPLHSGAFGFQLPGGYGTGITPNIANRAKNNYELADIGLESVPVTGTLSSGLDYYAMGWTCTEMLTTSPTNPENATAERKIHLLEIVLMDTDSKKVADLTMDNIQLLHFAAMIDENPTYNPVRPGDEDLVAATIWRTATAEELQLRPDRVGYYQGYFRYNVDVNTAELPVIKDDLPELVAKYLPQEPEAYAGKLVIEDIDGEICINGMPYNKFICPVELDADGILHIELQVQTDIDCDLQASLEAGMITSYDPKKPVTIKWYLKDGETGAYPADPVGIKELPVWQGPAAGGDTEEGGDIPDGGGDSGETPEIPEGTETVRAAAGRVADSTWTELDVTGAKTFLGNGKGTRRYQQKVSFEVNETGLYRVEIIKPGHIRAIYEDLALAKGECTVPDTFLIPGDIDGDGKTKLSDRTILLGFMHHHRMVPPEIPGDSSAEAALEKYEAEKYAADIDGDGKIDMEDINILMHKGYYNKVEEVVRQKE